LRVFIVLHFSIIFHSHRIFQTKKNSIFFHSHQISESENFRELATYGTDYQPGKKIQAVQIQHAVSSQGKRERMGNPLNASKGQGKVKKRKEKGRAMN
jgi:hypothetical protein